MKIIKRLKSVKNIKDYIVEESQGIFYLIVGLYLLKREISANITFGFQFRSRKDYRKNMKRLQNSSKYKE